jgi:hypothetical protein
MARREHIYGSSIAPEEDRQPDVVNILGLTPQAFIATRGLACKAGKTILSHLSPCSEANRSQLAT